MLLRFFKKEEKSKLSIRLPAVSDNVYEVARKKASNDGKSVSRPAAAINWKERKREGSNERNDEGCRAKPNCFPTKWFCARRRLASTLLSPSSCSNKPAQRSKVLNFSFRRW